MKVTILAIDGLEKNILDEYIEELPNFKKIYNEGLLYKVKSVFPADSVPAWNTIFSGKDPSEHGIVRGKDYLESYNDFQRKSTFSLEGNTFWDEISSMGYKCLVMNPFLAYPSWKINGVMVSGPSFVEGPTSVTPSNMKLDFPEAFGGYQALDRFSQLKKEMEIAYRDTKNLLNEFRSQVKLDKYDLSFLSFSTLDRIQHNTWRFFDKKDPLHKEDPYLSTLIFNTLKLFDVFIGEVLNEMNDCDRFLMISDHGFGQRPYKLLNLNEILRKNGFIKLNDNESSSTKKVEGFKTKIIDLLSKMHILDAVVSVARLFPFLSKYKKSDYLIDKQKSTCYVDELFNGKKPYCGLNFGDDIKNGDPLILEDAFLKVKEFLNSGAIPKPKWIKLNKELFKGKYSHHYPDICFELPADYGIEYNMFGEEQNESVTHYKISGGHLGAGVYGFYSKDSLVPEKIQSIQEFHNHVVNLFKSRS